RIRADHAALRTRPADGVEIRGGQIFASLACGAADLLRFSDHNHFHDLLSKSRAVVAEASASGVGRLLQSAKRNRLHLPAVIDGGINATPCDVWVEKSGAFTPSPPRYPRFRPRSDWAASRYRPRSGHAVQRHRTLRQIGRSSR